MSNTSALLSRQADLFIPSPAIVLALIIPQLSPLAPGAVCGAQSPLITGVLLPCLMTLILPAALGAGAQQRDVLLSQSAGAPVCASTLTWGTLLPAHDSQG